MIVLAHPFGNANVRALLEALHEAGLLGKFFTTLGVSNQLRILEALPPQVRRALTRRSYNLPNEKIASYPVREILRLVAGSARAQKLIEHERGWASIDQVWQELDASAASWLRKNKRGAVTAVYAYEDCALQLFQGAIDTGARRIYELPIAYWETARRLLQEEAVRYPEWEPTLGTRDSAEKLARKTRELELTEMVVCPSDFVLDSLPESARQSKRCLVAPFGSPAMASDGTYPPHTTDGRPLRVLFAGAMTQRKGLADLFAAMKLLSSSAVELVVMGSPSMPLEWYRERCRFIHEAPRPHADVLRLMRSCDIFVLPSIVEGRALVQQEAMACGLPLIVTPNAGGADLIAEGETGFLVPIRSPEALAEKISWCATNRASISGMAIAAQRRAAELTWRGYGERIVAAIRALIAE